MELKTIIFNSEPEFREYVILHSKDIERIIVFEDIPDHTIFFYSFTKQGIIIATKEPARKEFSSFQETYTQLANELHLHPVSYLEQIATVEFARN